MRDLLKSIGQNYINDSRRKFEPKFTGFKSIKKPQILELKTNLNNKTI